METWNLQPGDETLPGRTAVRLLGGGRRYEAYLAWDDARLALVVAKLVRPGQTDDPAALTALRREAQILERLTHPHLVRGYGAELGGPRPGLTLEFVEGPRLSTLNRRYGLGVEQLLPLALAVASALHYLHRQGIAHLDVKPRNIIMAGPPRLIDVSVARPFDELAHLASPAGTDGYMAPEQRDPARFGELGSAADVWGLGATLRASLGDARVPAPLEALIDAALEPEPAHRPSAAVLHARIGALVSDLPAPRLGRLKPGNRRALAALDSR